MAEAWYVLVTLDYHDGGEGEGHQVIRAGVPDDVYAIPNAWQAKDIEAGVRMLTFRDHVKLTADQKARMREMECVPVSEGVPATPTKIHRRDLVVKNPMSAEPIER